MILLLACTGGPKDSDTAPAVDPALAPVDAYVVVEVGTPATLEVTATPGDVTWTFGDGETGSGALVEHTWNEPGNYLAIAELLSETGRRLTAFLRVEVHRPIAVDPPVWSSMMAVDYMSRAWAVTPEADVVAVVDATVARYLPTCDEPRSLAVDAAVAGVACADGEVRFWNLGTLEPIGTAQLGEALWGIVGRNGDWFAVHEGVGRVSEILVGDTVKALPPVDLPGPARGIAMSPDGTLFVPRFPSTMDGGVVYVLPEGTSVLPLHPGPDSDTVTGGIPNLIETLAVSPDGGTVYVPMVQANARRGLLTTGEPLTFETTVRAALGRFAVGEDEAWEDRKVFDNQDRTIAVAPSPTGNHLAVLHPGTGTLQVVDAYTFDLIGSLPGAGAGLRGVAWREDRLYTYAWLDRAVTAWEMGEPGDVPTAVWTTPTVEAEPLPAEELQGKRLFHESTSRMARDGYIACASCHPDGTTDGLTWDFTARGEGLRNTITLEGRAGVGMGFLHWSANFDEVQDFENDIRNAFEGEGLLTDADWKETQDTLGAPKAGRSADLDALAAYVSSLTTTPRSPYPASPEGEARFTELGCDTCHPAPSYTDSALDELRLHDVGTLTDASGGRLGGELLGLDTPTLLGCWATAPYLHDGSAPTLEDAVAAHGELSADDVALLADFVRAL